MPKLLSSFINFAQLRIYLLLRLLRVKRLSITFLTNIFLVKASKIAPFHKVRNLLFRMAKEHFYPIDTRTTKNLRTKDSHKRTLIFGPVWKQGKTSESELLMNVSTSGIFVLPH